MGAINQKISSTEVLARTSTRMKKHNVSYQDKLNKATANVTSPISTVFREGDLFFEFNEQSSSMQSSPVGGDTTAHEKKYGTTSHRPNVNTHRLAEK